MSFFEHHEKKIYYEEHGTGDPVMLLHGNTVSGRFFTKIFPLLSDRYRVIAPDVLGCGRSDRTGRRICDTNGPGIPQ